jgi:hypothetical protein
MQAGTSAAHDQDIVWSGHVWKCGSLVATLGTTLIHQHFPIMTNKLRPTTAVMEVIMNVTTATSVRQIFQDEAVIISISASAACH